MSLLPVQVYGLEIPPGQDVLTPARQESDVPHAVFRITMAAIDPTEAPQADESGNIPSVPRATLKIVRPRFPDMMDELEDERLQRLMYGSSDGEEDSEEEDDDEEDDDDDELNGGPSDPAKSKKAKREAALKKLIEATQEEEESDEEMVDGEGAKTNGIKKAKKKGKEPATSSDDDDEQDDDEEMDWQELVICTLDTERNFQQPLDITIAPNEDVHFVVKGTHTVYLSGNYVIDVDEDDSSEEDDEEDYDLPDGLDDYDSEESEVDELDDIKDPRVTEIDSDEEAPKLVPAATKKGKNKRPAEDEADGLDAMIAKSSAAAETKLSKKQQKKLKNNKGEAVAAEEGKSAQAAKETPAKGDKKVQFAKNLEQGPTGSTAPEKSAGKGGSLGVKVIQGVTVDDRKLGSGRTVKKGDRVDVRYIGKLQDGKVFDSNKKGKPFSFKAGDGQVIKGWDIGIVGMSVGGERRLTIPAHLAYGSKSLPGIPANSQLIFDVKLLGIK